MTEIYPHWAYTLGDQDTQNLSGSVGQMFLILQWEHRSIHRILCDDGFDP